jgi:plastocyanin
MVVSISRLQDGFGAGSATGRALATFLPSLHPDLAPVTNTDVKPERNGVAGMRREAITTAGVALIVPVVAVVAVLVTLGLRSDSNGSAQANEVVIEDFAYSPTPLRARVGATITVTNADDAPHTLTADNGAFDTGDLERGDREQITIERTGRVRYHCEIHDYMTGTIDVDG